MLRSVCNLWLQKRMLTSSCTCYLRSVLNILPTNIENTGISYYNSLYLGSQIPENILSNLFSCCDSIATIPMPSFLLLHVFLGLQKLLGPISPAKMIETKLWTLITFFLAGSFRTIFCEKS